MDARPTGGESDPGLDGPRLELDRMLAQLVEHAQEAFAAQDRLRSLLRANGNIVGELSLGTVLRRIVEAACELVDAPFGALGVIAPDGAGLDEFIHVGLDHDTVARIGHLPEGKGLLGALIDDPRPIRLRDLGEDLRSVGFPEGHPPMRAFLGVPIRVRDEVFGNLYLAKLEKDEFSPEDEELVSSLAATAGVAIENARLYEEARRRQVWLRASAEVTRELLLAGGDALRCIGEHVLELAAADVVTVVRPAGSSAGGPERLEVPVAIGEGAERLTGLSYPAENTVSETVLRTGRPQVVADASDAAGNGNRVLRLADMVPVGPCAAVPLTGSAGVRGVLVVGRLHGRRAFSAADVEMATTFAAQASLALELADARRETQQLALLEDRARIARDLHDHVIQQLFAAGMTLQGIVATMPAAPAADRLEAVVDQVDDAIRQIRASIFQLRPHPVGGGLRTAVLEVATEVAPALGREPRVRFVGPVDTVSDEAMAQEVRAVVREALTNAAKHAAASTVEVLVEVTGPLLCVTVVDDGVGLGNPARRSGLDNLSRRAADRAGRFVVEPGPGGSGTAVRWSAPLAAS